MKKLLMGLAACTMLMTGCNNKEILEDIGDGQGQLSFAPGLGKTSRASEWTNTLLQGSAISTTPIKMYAYQESATTPGTFGEWFSDGLYYDGTAQMWKITSTRFRNTAETKFITYFPQTSANLTEVKDADDNAKSSFETANFAATGGKFPAFEYTVAATSKVQEDMLVGVTKVDANMSNITVSMRHILSQVNFGVVGYKGVTIAIRDIQIVGLSNKAVYTYGPENVAPAGKWGGYDGAQTYNYFSYTNDADAGNANLQPVIPIDANKGDRYIFGDGGKWGPGKDDVTFYPVGVNDAWANHTATAKALSNSLMLMPQTLTDDTKVTFEYQIKDEDGAFVAGGPAADAWAKGEFKINFNTGATDTDYRAMWEQNMRYVYMIDFTKFLDGAAVTFTVDVDMQPWENYDGEDGDGVVNIVVAGQPTLTNINKVPNGGSFFVATQTPTGPTQEEWAQVIKDGVWDMSGYDFIGIEKDKTLLLNFKQVIFNTKDVEKTPTAITLTLPNGYTATANTVGGTPITVTAVNATTFTISGGDRSENAVVIITNRNDEYSAAATLNVAIEGVTVAGTELIYKGKDPIDLTTMEPILLTAKGDTMTVKFNLVMPTVGKVTSDNGTWVYSSATKTATYTRE